MGKEIAMYEIQDNNGVIYSGDKDEMDNIYSILTTPDDHSEEEIANHQVDWEGDLKLVHVLAKFK